MPCQHGGTCEDGTNAYMCHCDIGYQGNNCETGKTTTRVNVTMHVIITRKNNTHTDNLGYFMCILSGRHHVYIVGDATRVMQDVRTL